MTVRSYFLTTQGVAMPVQSTKYEPRVYLEPSGASILFSLSSAGPLTYFILRRQIY